MGDYSDGPLREEDGWHFPYRDNNKKLHEVVVEADDFTEALEKAYDQMMKETDE